MSGTEHRAWEALGGRFGHTHSVTGDWRAGGGGSVGCISGG